MDKITILGQYEEPDRDKAASFSMITLNAGDMAGNWKRVSLTSDFAAKYYSYFFEERKREQTENLTSFVINELIENTAKYSDTDEGKVMIRIALAGDFLSFHISNFVSRKLADGFLRICKEIFEGNPEQLYIKKLEENAETNKGGSGLGYLTLINDYKVILGFKFESIDETRFQVTVQATLNCKEV